MSKNIRSDILKTSVLAAAAVDYRSPVVAVDLAGHQIERTCPQALHVRDGHLPICALHLHLVGVVPHFVGISTHNA